MSSGLRISHVRAVSFDGKTVTLEMDLAAVTTSNVTFSDGSLLIVGDNTTGTTGDDLPNTLTGGEGNDHLLGLGSNDTLIGGNGDDTLVDAADSSIQGGAGTDTLSLSGSGATLDLTLIPDTRITEVEVIDLTGDGDNSTRLALSDVLAISSITDTLRIDGNSGDQVVATDWAGWTQGASQSIGANLYSSWTQGGATLLIDTHVSSNLI